MRKEIRQEWARLNPVFVRPEDNAMQTVLHAIQETLHGFFSPFLMLGWIIKSVWGALINPKRS